MRPFLAALAALFWLTACSPSENNGADTLPPDSVDDAATDLDLAVTPDGELPQPDATDDTPEPGDTPADETEPPPGDFQSIAIAPSQDLLAVWGSGEKEYAVGLDGQIIRRQGSHWTPMKSPTTKDLRTLFGDGDDNIYAAGEKGTVIHFDGSTWSPVDLGLEEDFSDISFLGLWGQEGDFYLVGEQGTILYYCQACNGQWKKEDSLTSYNLQDVWGVSLVDIYAAAAGGTILRKLGGAWNTEQVAQGSVILNTLMGLSAKELYGGGTNGALVVHDSSGWSPKLSNDAYERTIHGVWAFAADDVWFVGVDGALVHSVAGKWNTAEIAGPFYKNYSFYDLWGQATGDEQQAWAVGESGAVLHFDGEQWADQAASPQVDLNDVAGLAPDNVLVVGGDGLLMAWDGTEWAGLDRPGTANLMAVAPYDGGFLAAGSAGALVRVNGSEVAPVATELTANLLGICSSGSQVVVVGEQGKLYTSADGETFTKVSTGLFDTLHDCAVVGDRIVAVGDMGKIIEVTDGTATTMPVATMANLHRVAAAPGGALYAVGDNGLIMQETESGWTKVHEEPGLFLYGAHAFDDALFAVGWAGRILRFSPEDGSVDHLESPDAGVLLQVWGTDAEQLVAVGKKGRMLTNSAVLAGE